MAVSMSTTRKSERVPLVSVLRLAAEQQLATDVDELGALDKELAPYAAKIARVEALRKAVRANFADAAPEKPFEAKGEQFVILVGPRARERSIDYPQLWKLAGVKLMRKIATVTFKALEAEEPALVAGVTTFGLTGSRSLKIFERGGRP